MIRRKESYDKKEKEKTNNYNFQGQSATSRRWFDLFHEQLKDNFRTRELYLYRKMYQTKVRDDDTKTFQIFRVPIGNAKITRKVKFHPAASVIKYHQKISNSCCLSSLSS